MDDNFADNKTELLDKLIAAMLKLKDSQDVHGFLEAMLTSSELQELSRRLKIVEMLRDGVPQREIAKTLGVGVATVSRGARVKDDMIFEKIT